MERIIADGNGMTDYGLLDHLSEELWGMYQNYLGAKPSEIRMDYELFSDDPKYDDAREDNQLWDMPEKFEKVIEMDNVLIPGMSIGYVAFGRYGNHKVIMECNASPFMVYWKEE